VCRLVVKKLIFLQIFLIIVKINLVHFVEIQKLRQCYAETLGEAVKGAEAGVLCVALDDILEGGLPQAGQSSQPVDRYAVFRA